MLIFSFGVSYVRKYSVAGGGILFNYACSSKSVHIMCMSESPNVPVDSTVVTLFANADGWEQVKKLGERGGGGGRGGELISGMCGAGMPMNCTVRVYVCVCVCVYKRLYNCVPLCHVQDVVIMCTCELESRIVLCHCVVCKWSHVRCVLFRVSVFL